MPFAFPPELTIAFTGIPMMPTKAVVDGKLSEPLFHGTSTLFYESIRETGLGGRRMLDFIRLPDAIRELLKHYEQQLEKIPNWDFERTLLVRIAEPEQNLVGSFLRYCGTYLTPSKQTAARYALLNEYGSEALTCTLKILNSVIAELPELGLREPFSNVLAFAGQPKCPIVIEACNVPENILLSERAGPCAPVLQILENALSEPDIFDLLVQQDNFELLQPIPASQLRFYKIISPRSGHDSMENLKLAPL